MASSEVQRKPRDRSDNDTNNNSADKNALIEQLRHQIEAYFSDQNLQNDPQLRSHMTEDGYIDISVIMNANLVNMLSNDRDLIVESIRGSKKLKMNSQETMVKALPTAERCTLILRDMPPEVKKEEILQIFAHPECGTVKEIRPDIGNTWFVKFHSEEECLKTVKYLQQHGNFRDKPLHVRVKSSSVYKTLPGDIGVPPAPLLNQLSAEEPNLGDMVMPMDNVMGPDIDSYDVNRFYDPTNTAYDPYYLEQDPTGQVMFGAEMLEYGTHPQRGGIESARAPGKDKRARENVPPNFIGGKVDERASDLMPRNDEVGGTRENNVGSGAVRKSSTYDQQQTSDYPSSFLFYEKEVFLKVFQQMDFEKELEIPSSMAGRDQRVISEDILEPISLSPIEDELQELSNVKETSLQGGKGEFVSQDEALRSSYPPQTRPTTRGRGKNRGRGRGVKQGRQNPGRGRLPNNRSFPLSGQNKENYAQGGRRDRIWNKNSGYTRQSHNNEIYIGHESGNTNLPKRSKSKPNARSITVTKTLQWVVAGSQNKEQEEKKQNKTKANRQSQNSRGVKYVPKGTGSEQIYRPKAQPVS